MAIGVIRDVDPEDTIGEIVETHDRRAAARS